MNVSQNHTHVPLCNNDYLDCHVQMVFLHHYHDVGGLLKNIIINIVVLPVCSLIFNTLSKSIL